VYHLRSMYAIEIRPSDSGALDQDHGPDRHQNLIDWSLRHARHLQKVSSKSVHNLLRGATQQRWNRVSGSRDPGSAILAGSGHGSVCQTWF